MKIESVSRDRMWTIVSCLLLAVLFGFMFVISFPVGPDPLIDAGREHYVPLALNQGKVLYRDIAYFNGPLSPYINALILSVVPFSIQNLKLIDAVFILLIACAVYVFSLKISGRRLVAFLAAFLFVAVFPLQVYYSQAPFFSYLRPYSHEMVHGLLFCLLLFISLDRYFQTPRTRYLAASGLLFGFLFLLKPEFYLAALLSVPTVVALKLKDEGRRPAVIFGVQARFFGFSFLPAAVSYLCFARHLGAWEAFLSISGGWRYILGTSVAKIHFYRLTFGTYRFSHNSSDILKSLLTYLLFFLAFRLSDTDGRAKRFPVRAILVSLPFLAIGAISAFSSFFLTFTTGFPFIVAVFIAVLLSRRATGRRFDNREYLLLAFLAFSLVLLVKILFAARVYNYGSVLAAPAALAILYFGMAELKKENVPATIAFVFLCGLISAYHISWSLTESKAYVNVIKYKQHYFRLDDPFANFPLVLDLIDRRIPAQASLLALPEGLLINVLTGRPHPSRYTNFMPPEFEMFGSIAIYEDIVRSRPDYILLIDNRRRPDWVYRSDFFRDYGRNIYFWVKTNYVPIESIKSAEISYELYKNAVR